MDNASSGPLVIQLKLPFPEDNSSDSDCVICDGYRTAQGFVCPVCWPDGLPEGVHIDGVLEV